MATTAKVILDSQPEKGEKAWKVVIEKVVYHIPKSTITSYLPATKTIEIETWILLQKGIRFKL